MKQPVWILNSSLLILFFISQLFLFMMQRSIPRRISIVPDKVTAIENQAIASIDITTIYTQDLFDSYQKPAPVVEKSFEETVAAIPQPPKIITPDVPVEKIPTFFPPLDVTLKGVIFIKDDSANCIAIIQLKKTKEERNYRVGDAIEDAQILKILSNRIIIIRSNGQQETLYLREEDAISDFNIQSKSIAQSTIELVSNNKYKINIDEFCKRIHNLGTFINLLDITTVYKQGKSFGCKIGKITKDSLGGMLGLMIDDIIVKIDDYFVDDLSNRLHVYDAIMQKRSGDVIEIVLYRGQDIITISYGLVDTMTQSIIFTPQQTHEQLMQELSKHQEKVQAAIEKSVAIQMISQEQLDVITDQPLDEFEHKNDRDPVENNQQRQMMVMQPDQNQNNVQTIPSQTFSSSDMHQKILMQERDKLAPTLQDVRAKDKARMMQQSSRNIIFNGIQQ